MAMSDPPAMNTSRRFRFMCLPLICCLRFGRDGSSFRVARARWQDHLERDVDAQEYRCAVIDAVLRSKFLEHAAADSDGSMAGFEVVGGSRTEPADSALERTERCARAAVT